MISSIHKLESTILDFTEYFVGHGVISLLPGDSLEQNLHFKHPLSTI